jgi:tetratricopeptide (TPR) repeat protein
MEHGADPASGSERKEDPVEIDASGILALDGMQASQAELSRARLLGQFLEALLPSLVDDGDAAQALHDVAVLRSYPLDDAKGALESIREAFARRPALHIARAYRKAAIRAGSLDDQMAALEGEIKLAPTPAYRAVLETERGGLYERAVGNLAAARQSYAAAVEINPNDVTALLALLRLALQDGDRAAAATGCKKIADAVGDSRVKAEFLAWAGRLYAASGSAEAALQAAVQGEVHAPESPSVRFLLERLYASADNTRELGAVVERGLSDGCVATPAGWFDLGYLYRYRLGDAERAEKAFGEVVSAGHGAARSAALGELSELAALRGDWSRVVALELERLENEADAGARAAILTRVGQVREERLDDANGAAEAYTKAIEADASFLPALEGAGRVFIKRGTVDKLVWMHRAEAAAASSPVERAGALVRAGELLVADPATVDEGIAALEEARAVLPSARAMFDALELALRRKGAYEKLCILYRSEVDRGVEPRRAAWLLTQIGELAALRLGDPKRAIEAFSIAAGIEGDGPRFALSRLAQLLEDADAPAELEGVLARLGALTEEPGEQASLLERAARLQERRGDVEAALASYRRALELAPPGHTVFAAAGRAFHRAERWQDLLTLFERAMLQGDAPERAHYAYRAGLLVARKLGRLDEGIEYLHETIALDPKHRAARVALAALYTEGQRWVELGLVLVELPASPSLLARRAAIAEAGGRHEEALGLWQAAQAAGLATTTPAQARLLARLGRWNQLAELYEKVQSNGAAAKLAIAARYRAAELRLERLGQPVRAVELLAAAVAGDPDSVPLLLAHERALVDEGGDHGWGSAAGVPSAARSPARRDALKALVARTRDPALRVALLSQLASTLPEAELVATRLNQMALSPRDPVITVHIEQTLEARRNREGLAALLRDQRRDPKSDPLLLASMDVQLGGLYE